MGSKMFPPQFRSQIEVSRRWRFQQLGSSSYAYGIARSDLLNLLMVNLSGTTNNSRLIAGVKIRRIEMWGISNGSTTQNTGTISVEWLSQFGPSLEVSDTAIPSIRPPYLTATPPAQSAASFWSLTGKNESEVLFNVAGSLSGSIMDIFLDVIFYDGESVVNITTTNAGTAGQLYMGTLPGSAPTTFVPVSYYSLG